MHLQVVVSAIQFCAMGGYGKKVINGLFPMETKIGGIFALSNMIGSLFVL